MIEGFEDITQDITKQELKLVPVFVKGFSGKIGRHCAVTSTYIIKHFKKQGIKITGSRVRKIINYIRMHDLVKRLVATSRGYYVENDPVKYKKYITSLEQRSYAIYSLIQKMKKQ